MSRSQILIVYRLLLPLFFVLAFPAWVLKMWKRGGWGTGLMQRLAHFREPQSQEPQGVIYIHAVSVGEVFIALKLIRLWLKFYPKEHFILAVTTSTGHEIAMRKSPEQVRVIYSPLDFAWMVRSVMNRFTPRQIVLVEAETWPHLLNEARKRSIPVSMVNARLSARSERRFRKFASMVAPLFKMVGCYCVQNELDAKRFQGLGIEKKKIHITGSIKFDPATSAGAEMIAPKEYRAQLDDFGIDRKIVMLASSHAGEEKLIAEAHRRLEDTSLLVVVPRHAERRSEVVTDLESVGYEVVLRSQYKTPKQPEKACLVVDTTGELKAWTSHADLLIIGKSWIGKGGQNPTEAIEAGVPLLCGPFMGNFEPLISMLHEKGGVEMVSEQGISPDSIALKISELLEDSEKRSKMTLAAKNVLEVHAHAVERTIKVLLSQGT